MKAELYPFQMLLFTVSGWLNRHQQDVIAYLVEENRVLKEQLNVRRRLPSASAGASRPLEALADCAPVAGPDPGADLLGVAPRQLSGEFGEIVEGD